MNNGVPDSPAGRRLRQVFDGMSGTAGLDAAEAFHPSFLASVSADAIAAHLAALASALGRFAFECDESHTSDHRTSGVVRGLRSARRVDCAVDAEPPHQITALVFSPIPFELGDIDDVPRMMTHHGCVGLTAAMLVDGEIAWARGWGMADADAHRPMTPDTFVQVGSISKPVAAAAAARLAEDGLVDLDADVNDYLKSWRLPGTGSWEPSVSLRRILTHTAGLSVWGFPGYRAGEAVSLVDVLDGGGNTPAIRAEALPGAMWRYSGGGYTVMQQVLEDVCGEPFPELMRRLVLEPFAMTRSTYDQPLPARLEAECAVVHLGGQVAPDRIHVYPEMAAAGLWTTPSDLLRFAMNMPALMTTPSDVEPTMGLGIFLAGDPAAPTLHHGGANYGVAADLAWTGDGRIGFAAMVNDGNGAVLNDLGRWIARATDRPELMARSSITGVAIEGMQRSRPLEHREPIELEVPDPRAGRYEVRPDWSIEITSARELIAPGQPPLPLYAQTPTRWASRDLDVAVEFGSDRLTVHQLGRQVHGIRVSRIATNEL